ncbi:MFS transporter [Bacillus sp. FSL H8-0547]
MKKIHLLSAFFLVTAVMVASSIYVLIPLYASISEDTGLSFNEAVLGSTFFTFFYAAGLFTFGPLTEKAGKKNVLIGGFAIAIAATAMLAFSSSATFIPLRSLQGFCLGCFAPVAYAYCFESFREKEATMLISLINMGFLMSGMIGQLISSVIAISYDWRTVFLFFAVAYALLTGCLAWLIDGRKKNTEPKSLISSFRSIFRNGKLVLCYILTFAMLMSFVSYYEGFHRAYSGIVSEEVLFWCKAAGLAGALFSLFSVKWIGRFGKTAAVRYAMLLIILAFLLNYASGSLFMSAALSVLFTASLSICIPAVISMIGEAAGRDRATAVSLYSCILLTGASIGPLLAGVLSFQSMLLGFSVFYGIAAAVTLFESGNQKSAR